MEKPKFTPGPWDFDDYSIFGINGGDVVTLCPGRVYDEYDSDPDTLDVSPENIALIIAAPDMFAALETALLWMDCVDVCYTGGKEYDVDLEKMRAALAKARGQT